jgi:uncharacterized protein (DUF2384 family)
MLMLALTLDEQFKKEGIDAKALNRRKEAYSRFYTPLRPRKLKAEHLTHAKL